VQLGVKRKSDIYTTALEGNVIREGEGKTKEGKRNRGNSFCFFFGRN